MPNTNAKTRLRSRRLKSAALVFASLIAVTFVARLSLEWALRQTIEHYASALNGAQVSIDDIEISLLKGRFKLRGIQVTHHVQTMRNLLEIDEVKFHFRRRPLLSLKLIIPDMHIEGVRFNTVRDRSGLNAGQDTLLTTALLDRVAPGVYDPLQASLGKSPLRNLGLLSLGLGARNTVELMQQEFESHLKIKSLETEFDRLLASWDQSVANLARSATTPDEGERQRTRTLLAKVEREYESLISRVNSVSESLPADMQRVLRKLGLPDSSTEDFTRELLGRRTLNHLERLSYWVDLSRRRLGATSVEGPLVYPAQAGGGAEVRFPTSESLPRVWIQKLTIHSAAGDNPNQGNIDAVFTDLSSERGVDYKPVKIRIEAEFPGLRIYGLRANALLDHGRPEPRDQVDLSIGSFPLSEWTVEQTADLKVTVDSRVSSLAFQADYQGDALSADWTAHVRNAEFNVNSRHRPLETTLRDIFTPLASNVSVSGSVSGTPGKYDFRIQSNVGRRLAVAVGDRFRLPMNAAKETIREELQDRFAPAIERLRVRVQNGHTQVASRLIERLSDLN